MKIMILGTGVIGSLYGYLFQKAGHSVQHYIRKSKRGSIAQEIKVNLLDGRTDPEGITKTDVYHYEPAEEGSRYDFILVSVSAGKLKAAVQTLNENHISGPVLLMCGIWEDRTALESVLNGRSYILGYPVAGGCLKDYCLDGVLFDHMMLEGRAKAKIDRYDSLLKLIADAKLKPEIPYDMLEWIWLHMAINAGVIATAGATGGIENSSKAANQLMDSTEALTSVIYSIRETSKIIASRGVVLKRYRNELLPYKIPAWAASRLMLRMFRSHILTRRIMTLHSNLNDLLFVCKSVYNCGKANHVSAPVFYSNCQKVIGQLHANP